MIVGRRTGALTDIIAVGPGSYLNDLIGIAGGVNRDVGRQAGISQDFDGDGHQSGA